MYDSILYGNGLTIAVEQYLVKNVSALDLKYLDSTRFILDFLELPTHEILYRKFLLTLNKNASMSNPVVEKARDLLKQYKSEIQSNGIEGWVSTTVNKSDSEKKALACSWFLVNMLYNYWFSYVSDNILVKKQVSDLLEEVSDEIKTNISKKIYTINFDTILDNWLSPEHIHGKFSIPYNHYSDLIAHKYDNDKMLFTFLFGGNGYDKHEKLTKLHDAGDCHTYDLGFLYNNSPSFSIGHLLIYGVGFAKSHILDDDYFVRNSHLEFVKYAKSVDGHLLARLKYLVKNNYIDKITIAYHSANDLARYKEMFEDIGISSVTDYKHTRDIFSF